MIWRIRQASFLTSAVKKEQWPKDEIPEFVFLGRSNVGKSTFLNTLANQKNLARVSQRPGKTQLLNFFTINQDQLRFVDVPGYGFAKVSNVQKQQFAEMMDEYLQERKNLKAAFLLLDIRHKPTQDDLLMLQYLQSFHIDIYLIATKADKIGKTHLTKQKKLIISTLELPEKTPMIYFSSFKGMGVEEVFAKLSSLINKK